MFQINRIDLSGNVTGPAVTKPAGNSTVTRARLIHSVRYETEAGEARERRTPVDLEIWARNGGENFAALVTTKTPVHVTGSLELAEWTAEDGTARRRHFIRVAHWQFIERRALAAAAPETPRDIAAVSAAVGEVPGESAEGAEEGANGKKARARRERRPRPPVPTEAGDEAAETNHEPF